MQNSKEFDFVILIPVFHDDDKIGPLKYGSESQEVFLGKDYNEKRNTSDHVSELIDNEISKLIKKAEDNAIRILNKYISKLHNLANALLDMETLDSEQFVNIINNGYIAVSSPSTKSSISRKTRRTTPPDVKSKTQDWIDEIKD